MKAIYVLLGALVLSGILLPSVRAQTDWEQEWSDFVQFFVDILEMPAFNLFNFNILMMHIVVIFVIVLILFIVLKGARRR